MQWIRLGRIRSFWTWYTHLNAAVSLPATIAILVGLPGAVAAIALDIWEWVLPLVLGIAVPLLGVMWFIERRRRVNSERKIVDTAPHPARAPQPIEIEVRVERDQNYGPARSKAYLIITRVRSADGKVHPEAREPS